MSVNTGRFFNMKVSNVSSSLRSLLSFGNGRNHKDVEFVSSLKGDTYLKKKEEGNHVFEF